MTFYTELRDIVKAVPLADRKPAAEWLDRDGFLRDRCGDSTNNCQDAGRACHYPSHLRGTAPDSALFALARVLKPNKAWIAMGNFYMRVGWTFDNFAKLNSAWLANKAFRAEMLNRAYPWGGEREPHKPAPPSPEPKPEAPKPPAEPKPKPSGGGDAADVLRDLIGEDPRIPMILERLTAVEQRKGGFKATITMPDLSEVELGDNVHKSVPRIVRDLLLNPIRLAYVYGPTGAGKTHAVKPIAKALAAAIGVDRLPYIIQSISRGTSEGDLLGTLLPTGENGRFEYRMSALLRCFTEGGLCVLDEADNVDATVILIANSLMANGELFVPKAGKTFTRHKHFFLLFLANTLGQGPDALYVAREQQDAAFLNRVQGWMHHMGYDEVVEEKLASANASSQPIATEALTWVRSVRETIENNRLRRHVSTRDVTTYALKRSAGDSRELVRKDLLAAWSPDEVKKLAASARP